MRGLSQPNFRDETLKSQLRLALKHHTRQGVGGTNHAEFHAGSLNKRIEGAQLIHSVMELVEVKIRPGNNHVLQSTQDKTRRGIEVGVQHHYQHFMGWELVIGYCLLKPAFEELDTSIINFGDFSSSGEIPFGMDPSVIPVPCEEPILRQTFKAVKAMQLALRIAQ